jgi:nitrite reductase/ring-hydroxylating ferredoxin subunit
VSGSPGLDRRRLCCGAALLGTAGPLLAACGGSPSSTAASSGVSAGDRLVAAADVPVGGGVIVKDAKVVVTQPRKGQFKAFTAVCTHQKCAVSSVADGAIVCSCHGSRFSIEDGSVRTPPAEAPLAEQSVVVKGGQVTAA